MICVMNHKRQDAEKVEWGVFRGDRLRNLREGRELSKVDLMRMANDTRFRPGLNSPSRLSDLERLPDQNPSMPLLAALAEVLETSTDYLLGLTDDFKPASDLEDQVVIGVKEPVRRHLLQEICNLLVEMSDEDAELLWRMARRLGATEPTDEKVKDKWNDMWLSVWMIGGADLVIRFERELKVRRPRFIRSLMEDQSKKMGE